MCSPMTSQGSPHAHFRRAVATGNLIIIRAAAAELGWIGVADAAAILLVIARVEPHSYERAAIRWLAKLCSERSRIALPDIAQAAGALEALPHDTATARTSLANVCRRAGLLDAAAVFSP